MLHRGETSAERVRLSEHPVRHAGRVRVASARRHSFFLATALALAPAIGCGERHAPVDSPLLLGFGDTVMTLDIPVPRTPSLRGVITRVDGDTIHVEGLAGTPWALAKVRVALDDRTAIWRVDSRERTDRNLLRPGQLVSAWFLDMLIAPVYPITATAVRVQIEADSLQGTSPPPSSVRIGNPTGSAS